MRLIALLLALFTLPAQAVELRITTWNIAWASLRPTGDPDMPREYRARTEADWALLRQYAQRLEADIIAFQEIDGPRAAARIFDERTHAFFFPDENDIQRAGFAVRRTLRVTQNPDLAALDIRPNARFSLRRGVDITVEAGTSRLRLLAVHLNAGCREGELQAGPECNGLSQQANVLAGWIAERRRENAPFLILGDFNRRIAPGGDSFMQRLTDAAPLTRLNEGFANPCFADARGGRPFISHLFAGGAARNWAVNNTLRVMVYAERDARERLSDHCPISVRMRLP